MQYLLIYLAKYVLVGTGTYSRGKTLTQTRQLTRWLVIIERQRRRTTSPIERRNEEQLRNQYGARACLMSLSRHAWRRTVRNCGRPESDHLWIGDDFVAHAFARFVGCNQRRHGSNVPGPLEARRRLNRRRNMNFARASAGAGTGTAVDVVLLFGAGNTARTSPQTPINSEEHAGP